MSETADLSGREDAAGEMTFGTVDMPSPSDVFDAAVGIVEALITSRSLPACDVPAAIIMISATLRAVALPCLEAGPMAEQPAENADPPEVYAPAVPVETSVTPDHIVSLIDGKPYKALKRHLSAHGLSPADYRARYGLPADYPMTAPSYSARRSELAKAGGLGRKPRLAAAA